MLISSILLNGSIIFFFSKIQTNEENFNKLTSCITIRNISFEWCQYFRVFFFQFPQANYVICENLVKRLLNSPRWFRLEQCIRKASNEQEKTISQRAALGILMTFFSGLLLLALIKFLADNHFIPRPF